MTAVNRGAGAPRHDGALLDGIRLAVTGTCHLAATSIGAGRALPC